MGKRRDPNFTTGHLCRFCGELVPWGTILRLIRVDPDTPGFMLSESACHTECLQKHLRPGVELTFHRHWNGRAPMLDDEEDIYLPLSPGGRGLGEGEEREIKPCAMCGKDIAPEVLVRLRVQKPVGRVIHQKYGTSEYAIKDGGFTTLLGVDVSVAGIVVFAAIFPLAAFYFMDRLWYHRLLEGSVEAGIKAESALKKIGFPCELGSEIKNASPFKMWFFGSRRVRSKHKMDLFYAILLLSLLLVAGVLGFGLPNPPRSATAPSPSGLTKHPDASRPSADESRGVDITTSIKFTSN